MISESVFNATTQLDVVFWAGMALFIGKRITLIVLGFNDKEN